MHSVVQEQGLAASRVGRPVLVNDHLTSSAITSLARVGPVPAKQHF